MWGKILSNDFFSESERSHQTFDNTLEQTVYQELRQSMEFLKCVYLIEYWPVTQIRILSQGKTVAALLDTG